jgi:hypothetical protein
MSWRATMETPPSLAPDWFVKAKHLGASEAALRTLVRNHCRLALAPLTTPRDSDDDTADEIVVELMFQMYDNGCADC